MRCLRKNAQGSPIRDAPREPLSEAAIPLKERSNQSWAAMDDGALVEHAKTFIEKNAIKRRLDLCKADSGLHAVIQRRGLMDSVFGPKANNWRSMEDASLLNEAEKVARQARVSTHGGFSRAAPGLYNALVNRGLADSIGLMPRRKRRKLNDLGDDDLVTDAKRLMRDGGIKNKTGLARADGCLYKALKKRGLLKKLCFESALTSWASMSNEELVGHAREIAKKHGVSGRKKFTDLAHGLFNVLLKRGLLDAAGLKSERNRPWVSMTDEEILSRAGELMRGKGITRSKELEKANPRIYHVLQRRKLLSRISFERKKSDWASMSDNELLAFAKGRLTERNIHEKAELKEYEPRLFDVLLRRGLLKCMELKGRQGSWRSMDNDSLVSYAKNLLLENGIATRGELSNSFLGLCKALKKRGLLDIVLTMHGGRQRTACRCWNGMDDEALVGFAKEFIVRNGIASRKKLEGKDSGLHAVLYRRGLLGFVFAEIEQSKSQSLESELVSGLRKAADAMEEFGEGK